MLHILAASATKGIEKARTPCDNLKIGMYVCQLDIPWLESPFTTNGFTIKNHSDIQKLQQHCQYVYIDITRETNTALQNYRIQKGPAYETKIAFNDHLAQSIATHTEALSTVQAMLSACRSGKLFNTNEIKACVESCVNTIIDNPDPMLWLSMIKNKDAYTAEHSLNVSILSIALGRAEGLAKEDLECLGLCAVLHDIGKVKIPDDILNKEGRFSNAEFETMKMHTVHGKKILLGQKNIPDEASEIAFSHHEKLDGTGYPRGLKGSDIPYFVRLITIADAYDAMTSGRVYAESKPAAEALKIMLTEKNSHFDADLLNVFINCIGVYPLGSLAELMSGEIGFVLPSSSNSKLLPRLLIVKDKDKNPCPNYFLDLACDKHPQTGKPFMIKALHPDGTFDLQLADYKFANIEQL